MSDQLPKAPRQLAPRIGPIAIYTSPAPTPRRKASSAACLSCRRRKSRCDAQRPTCVICRRHNILCRYDAAPRETPGQARQRKAEETHERLHDMERIYNMIQTRSENDALEILRRIRGGSGPGDVLRLVESGDVLMDLALQPETRLRYEFPFIDSMPRHILGPQNEYLATLIYEYTSTQSNDKQYPVPLLAAQLAAQEDEKAFPYLRPYHAATIADSRLSKIVPSDWTNVSKDDVFMRKVIHDYFLYDYQWHCGFQKDRFLESMILGSQTFCSSLLVNAILAHACHSAKGRPDRAEYWKPWTPEYQFMAEAKRLWDLEVGEKNLTTIQAGIVLYIAHGICGADSVGRSYLYQSVQIGEALGIFSPGDKDMDSKIGAAHEFTAWAVFCSQSLNQWYFWEPPLKEEPPNFPLPDPVHNIDWYGEICVQYPSSGAVYPTHFGLLFHAHCRVNVILNDAARRLFSTNGKSPRTDARETYRIYEKLLAWYAKLPEPLVPRNIVFPAQLDLHMHYFNSIIRLMRATVDIAQTQYPGIVEVKWTGSKTIDSIVSHAVEALETLVRLYYLRHSFEALDSFFLQPLTELSFIRQRELADVQNSPIMESLLSTIVLCAKGFSDQGRNHILGRVLLDLFKKSVSINEAHLIARHVPESYQTQTTPIKADQIFSRWPVNVLDPDREPREQGLTAVLKRSEEYAWPIPAP